MAQHSKRNFLRAALLLFISFLILYAAPFAGGLAKGLNDSFFSYPPLVQNLPPHAEFNWLIFVFFTLLIVGGTGVLLYLSRAFSRPPDNCTPPFSNKHHFPFWGTVGLAMITGSWIIAWGKFEWTGPLRHHMFAPLWFGYVLVMDGFTFWRTGTSLMARYKAKFLYLFPASAISWWYFEFLNRLIQNWWYRGMESFSGLHYIIYATICFSTVIPAILESRDFILSFPSVRLRFQNGMPVSPLSGKSVYGFCLLSLILLFCIGRYPEPFFFFTWLAPAGILAAALRLQNAATPLTGIPRGDFRNAAGLALGALLCGFFWEMWNVFSMPQWNYSVPFVQRFHLFEMPALGYAGYLPFGIICAAFWQLFAGLFPESWKMTDMALSSGSS